MFNIHGGLLFYFMGSFIIRNDTPNSFEIYNVHVLGFCLNEVIFFLIAKYYTLSRSINKENHDL